MMGYLFLFLPRLTDLIMSQKHLGRPEHDGCWGSLSGLEGWFLLGSEHHRSHHQSIKN